MEKDGQRYCDGCGQKLLKTAKLVSNEGGKDHNVAESFIANPSGENDGGFALEVTARPDGTFTVRNDRNRFEKTYRKESRGPPRASKRSGAAN